VSDSRFEALLDRYQGGEATPAEVAELVQLLRTEAALRTVFVEHHLLQAQLYKAGAAGAKDAQVAPRRRSRAVRWLVAALLLIAVGLGLVSFIARPGNEVVAGQVLVDGIPTSRIPDGAEFMVSGSSSAVIQLADGSQATFDPASQAIIRGRSDEIRQGVELTQGGGKFQVAHAGGSRFRVQTPVGSVTALGTEFTVQLEAKQKKTGRREKLALAVAVTEGSVQVDVAGKSFVLQVGDNRRFEDDGDQNNVDDGQKNDKDQGNQQNQNKQEESSGNRR